MVAGAEGGCWGGDRDLGRDRGGGGDNGDGINGDGDLVGGGASNSIDSGCGSCGR